MFKQLLLVVLLAIALSCTEAGRNHGGGGGKGGGGGGKHGGGGGKHGGGGRPSGGSKPARPIRQCRPDSPAPGPCGLTYPNGTQDLTLSNCPRGLECKTTSDLSVSMDGGGYGLHFCNRTFELKADMACKLVDADGAAVCNQSECIVGECNSETEVVTRGGHGENLTATFCGSVPTDFNFGAAALRRACGYQKGEENVTLRQCRDEYNVQMDCPFTSPLDVQFQGATLPVYYCPDVADILAIFGNGRKHHDSSEESHGGSSSHGGGSHGRPGGHGRKPKRKGRR